MWPRRTLPLPLALLAPPLATPAVASVATYAGGWRFRMLRNGEAIGTHTVALERRGAETIAVSDVSVAPRVLGVVVYRYEHRYAEVTSQGRFLQVESWLNRNGRVVEVRAEATRDAVVIEGPAGTVRMPANAAPLSWWEPRRFGRVPLFGTSTGQEMRVAFARSRLPDGGERVRVTGELEVELAYDAAGGWSGFSTTGEDGSTITYAAA